MKRVSFSKHNDSHQNSLWKLDTSTKPSSLKCTSSRTSIKSTSSKVFNWSRELPRHNSEYVDKNYDKAFNNVAEQLNTIGGLGRLKCINKKRHGKLINRPTQVEKFSHTTTKLLPNFSITEQLKPIVCEKAKHMSIHEHIERVRIAENLPISDKTSGECGSDTIKLFNHENPFHLDLNALSEYQKQRSNAEDIQRRRNYQIIRRTKETKKLKTEGAERIKQEERDEKFKLPAFFRIKHENDEQQQQDEMKSVAEKTDPETNLVCKVVSILDKPKNKEIVELHYQHKEDKLRQRIRDEKERQEALEKEKELSQRVEKENEVFRLADESFPPSECSCDNEIVATLSNATTKFDYRENEMKLSSHHSQQYERLVENSMNAKENQIDAKNGIPCGQRIGKRVILRGFHDRTCTEPRGRSNLHRIEMKTNDCYRTHKEWLHAISNDPKIVIPPPKGKSLSSIKRAYDPNDDKNPLFNHDKKEATMIKNSNKNLIIGKNIDSPIKHHIKEINKKLKQKYLSRRGGKKSLKSQIDMNAIQKQYQRMKVMGIPTKETSTIELESSETTHLEKNDKLTSKDKHSEIQTVPEAVKLIPKIPSLCCDINDECEKSGLKSSVFEKAQPRGNDPEMLRTDKSLPWIQNEINSALAVKKEVKSSHNIAIDNWNHVSVDSDVKKKKNDENQSDMRRNFNRLIANKLQDYKIPTGNDSVADDPDIDYEIKTSQSVSTLSSDGTNFTNDSGSYFMILDEKIPKSNVNIGKKFQNRSLVTTEIQPSLEHEPYFIGDLSTLKRLRKPPDRFHTQKTRSCANLRERLNVKSVDYEDELIGNKKSQFATDIDEFYIKEFYHERSRTEFRFKRLSEMVKMREGFRKKIETYYIIENIMMEHFQGEKTTKDIKKVTDMVSHYEQFLKEQKEKTHRSTMKIMQEVKNYYHTTGQLQIEHDHLQSQIEPMKMKIFYLGNDFSRLSRYQHFQYLLMPMERRIEYDHLHRNQDDGKLEDIIVSLKTRDTKNIWDRENVTVNSIMKYIDEVYCNKTYKMIFPFKSGKEMINAINVLQSKSLKVLSKFTYASMKFLTLESKFESFTEMSESFISHYESTIMPIKTKWKFLDERCKKFSMSANEMVSRPLEESLKSEILQQLNAYCQVFIHEIICGRGSAEDEISTKLLSTVEKFRFIERKVLKMFTAIDKIPKDLFNELEQKIRKNRTRKIRIAKRAYKIELNLEATQLQLERLFAKPAQRKRKIGKWKRLFLSQKPIIFTDDKPLLDPQEEQYLQAFMDLTDDKDVNDAKFDPNVKLMIEKIKNESTPFYIDRFIESLGINMKKLSPLDVESIIEDEEARFKFKELLPNARIKMKYMEFEMELQKESDIQKSLYMYQK